MISLSRNLTWLLITALVEMSGVKAESLCTEDGLAIMSGALQVSSQVSQAGAGNTDCGGAPSVSVKAIQCHVDNEKAQVIHVPMRHYRPETENSKTVTAAPGLARFYRDYRTHRVSNAAVILGRPHSLAAFPRKLKRPAKLSKRSSLFAEGRACLRRSAA